MAQIAQKVYDLKPLENYLKEHPNASNEELYEKCNATTPSQKSSVRAKERRLNKKKNGALIPPGKKTSSKRKKLTEEFIEHTIRDGLDNNPGNIQLIGRATEFFIKVKGNSSEMEEEIDIKELINSGLVKKFSN